MNGMNAMWGMRGMTGLSGIKFKRLTPSSTDMSGI